MIIIATIERPNKTRVVLEAQSLAEAFDTDLYVVNMNVLPPATDIRPSVEDSKAQERLRTNAAELAETVSSSVAPNTTCVGLVGDNPA